MPKVKPGESRNDYLGRCIPVVMAEGMTQEQAVGKCEGMFNHSQKTEMVKKSITTLEAMIRKAEEEEVIKQYEPELLEIRDNQSNNGDLPVLPDVKKAITVDGFESPEPGDLSEDGKNLLAKVYASCRKDGGDKEKCAKIAWSAVNNAGYKSLTRLAIMKMLEKKMIVLKTALDGSRETKKAKTGEIRIWKDGKYEKQENGSWKKMKQTQVESKVEKWIGVDLDGTLAKFDEWKGADVIGEPIQPMIDRVKAWLKEGKIVKIFTARANGEEKDIAIDAIKKWSIANIGQELPITSEKDKDMEELWDDRAHTVESNTGAEKEQITQLSPKTNTEE